MRDIFIKHLTKEAHLDDEIMLIVGDLGYSVIEDFQLKNPKQFLNAGVAEQNMTGLAAGLASEGYKVFTYSIGNFNTFRCAEQIRNDIDYHKFNVTIVSVGGGLSYGSLGYSHHLIQDYALMRSFPNMTIYSPCCSNEVRLCLNYILETKSPSYLRLGKGNLSHKGNNLKSIDPNKFCLIQRSKSINSKKCILITGNVLNDALKMNKLKKYNDYHILSVPIWGMKFKTSHSNEINKWDEIITLEDHLEDGGFGSYILECNLKNKFRTLINVKSLNPSVCGIVGDQETLKDHISFVS